MGKRIDLRAEVLASLNALECQRSSLYVLKRDFHIREAELQKELAKKTEELQYLRRRYETADSEMARLDREIAEFSIEDRIRRERMVQHGGMSPIEREDAEKARKVRRLKERADKLRKQLKDLGE